MTMKRIIFVTIFVLAFCFTAFPQDKESLSRLLAVSKTSNIIFSDLDSLFIELNNEIKLFGVIKIESNTRSNVLKQFKIIQSRFAFRCKIDTSRFLYAISLVSSYKSNRFNCLETVSKKLFDSVSLSS